MSLIKTRTVPPVAIAMSFSWFFLLSPNPGAFTATTCSPTFNLEELNTCYSPTVLITKTVLETNRNESIYKELYLE